MSTPQLYTPDDLQAALVADFKDRQISAVVEVGEWSPDVGRGEARVIIDFGDGEIGEPGGHWQPGLYYTPTGTTGQIAAAGLDDAQRFVLWIHAPSTGASEAAGAAGRRNTDQLLRATMIAIRRALGSPFREKARVRWPGKDDPEVEGYTGFVRGTLCRAEILLASPILDDAFNVITVTGARATVQFEYPDGTLTDPEAA